MVSPAGPPEAFQQLLRGLALLSHVYVMGGCAEDALLYGRLTRARADLDLLVEQDPLRPPSEMLTTAGTAGLQPSIRGPAGEALALETLACGVRVEVWPAQRDTAGLSIVLPGGASGFFRLRLPPDTLDYPMAGLDGVAVPTVSPAALCAFRAVSAQTRGSEAQRAEDRRVLALLAKTLLPGQALETLSPHIEAL